MRLDKRVSDVDDAMRELAGAHGVETQYYDWRGEQVFVEAETLLAVLGALGVDATTPEARARSLRQRRIATWTRMLPPYVVTSMGRGGTVDVHVAHGAGVDVWVVRADGSFHADLRQLENNRPPQEVDGRLVGEATFALPADLLAGYHSSRAYSAGAEQHSQLIVAPSWLAMPHETGDQRLWGLAAQLYSVRSRRSWGVGDLCDLADLATWAAAEHDAAFVLVNPMHAGEPVPPLDPSPYRPTTRRFANPIYLRVERIPEYADLDPSARAKIDRLGAQLRTELTDCEQIERDASWTAKRAALEIVHAAGLEPGRALAYQAFRRQQGRALDDFARWCALSEQHGPDWHDWPPHLRHPRSAAVAQFVAENGVRIDFHCWLQWLLDEQLAGTQSAAQRAGMALGIVHDLAVGVSPLGADAWAWQDEFAQGITVGAPPDPYAQTGQDWTQPPWRPDRLAEVAYAPFRELVANVLRHAGGLRVDHVIGLFRLWWIPVGAQPTKGTYVRYDHEAFLAILAIEAQRAGAVVVGEDLGTVEPWVRVHLRERGVLGTSILWFEFDWDGDGAPLPPERWREYCLASVTTHDLPPSVAYLAGDHVRLRHELGLLTRSLDVELAADRAEQEAWLRVLRERGLLSAHAGVEETVVALHRALLAAPSRLRCLALTDAVGDRRTQNQPGTLDEYPNWRVPLSGPDGRSITLEEVFTDPHAARLAEIMRGR